MATLAVLSSHSVLKCIASDSPEKPVERLDAKIPNFSVWVSYESYILAECGGALRK